MPTDPAAMPTEPRSLAGVTILFGLAPSGPLPDPFFEVLGGRWRATGLAVEQVTLDPSQPEEALVERILGAATRCGESDSLVLAGFSLGAKIAARAAARHRSLALLCFGHPFHARGDPGSRAGLQDLRRVTVPTLVVQGSRDAHGNREEVRGYGPLPPCVQIHWLEDGNHRFRPRLRSGQTDAGHVGSAAAASIEFIARMLEPTRGP